MRRKKRVTLEVNSQLDEHLQALAAETRLSPKAVLERIVEHTLGSSLAAGEVFAAWRPPLDLRLLSCGGRCFGVSTQRRVVDDGTVPDDLATDPVLNELMAVAKRKARLYAIEQCMNRGGESCICAGGDLVETSRDCTAHTRFDGSTFVLYVASATYSGGRCKKG